MSEIEKAVRAAAELAGFTVPERTRHEEEKTQKFKAWHYFVMAGDRVVLKIVDRGGSWPVSVELHHANPDVTTNQDATNLLALKALLVGFLASEPANEVKALAAQELVITA